MSSMKNIPGKIYLQIGDECDSEDFNELSEVSWCKDKIYDNDIEYTLQNQMDNITEPEIRNLEDILLRFSEAHNMLAKTSLSKEEYQPISGLLAKAKVELFNFCNDHKAALQNKVSDPLPVIPDWIIKYDQKNYQSSAGKAIRFLIEYASIKMDHSKQTNNPKSYFLKS